MTDSSLNKNNNHKSNLKKVCRSVTAAAFWLLLWQSAAIFLNNELLLPDVVQTMRSLLHLSQKAEFWGSCLLSMLRVISGFAAGCLTAIVLAVLASYSKIICTLISPALKTIRAVPVASFIILAMVWINSNALPAFIAFLMVLPMVWSATLASIRQTDKKLLEMAKVFRFSKGDIFLKIYIPSCKDSVISAALSALGFAWKSAIAAEVISRPVLSLGKNLYDSKVYLETADAFAVTFTIVVLSMGLEHLIHKLINLKGGAAID